ncbi:hypothetical protein AK51_18620 [Serratia nematodiphila DZ0503SBS1]|nr:hypothetical protein AK51_18620 [Serratia nematodiphila DZ0503SBS1]
MPRLLFALQSPTFTAEQLRQLTDEFLQQMHHELTHVSVGELEQTQQALQQTCNASAPSRCNARGRLRWKIARPLLPLRQSR